MHVASVVLDFFTVLVAQDVIEGMGPCTRSVLSHAAFVCEIDHISRVHPFSTFDAKEGLAA